MKVKEILGKKSREVITILSDKSLLDASKLLTRHNIGALIVVNKKNEPVGILSERDIVRNIAERSVSALDTAIETAMTKDIIIGFPEDALSDVSSTMTNRRIRHLPIVEDKDLIGMISIGDIVKAQLDHAEHEAHNLRQYITGGYS